MAVLRSRNHLVSWLIGLVITLAVVIWIGVRMGAESPAPPFINFIVLAILPAVYLTLMYLTLRDAD
jgi:hypothetical protein